MIQQEESAAGYRKPGAAASGNLRLAQAPCIWCKVRGGGHSPGYLSPRECNQIGYAVILVIDRERESRFVILREKV